MAKPENIQIHESQAASSAHSPARALCALLLSLSITACALPRVPLQAPASTASEQERIEAYESLRPVGRTSYHFQSYNSNVTHSQLHLANNDLVSDPRDLIPVVPPASKTTKAAHKWKKHRNQRLAWNISRGAWAVLTPFAFYGWLTADETSSRKIWLGTGIAAAVFGITSYFLAQRSARLASIERRQAFTYYHLDLLKRLDLDTAPAMPNTRYRDKADIVLLPRTDPSSSLATAPGAQYAPLQ